MCPTVNEMEFHLPAPQSSSISPPNFSWLIHDCSRSVKHTQLPSVVISSACCESRLLKVPLLSSYQSHTPSWITVVKVPPLYLCSRPHLAAARRRAPEASSQVRSCETQTSQSHLLLLHCNCSC